MRYLDRLAFDGFLRSLVDAGYALIGPTVRDGAIVLDRIDGAVNLPAGVGEELLVRQPRWSCVSLYMPTHRSGPETQRDPFG